ncbi:hypothetical protein ACIBFB_12590 [Nocardiopsis sp. NPDC050513]|uniref:hypothetical protein n=1 Tax=Nocardiopsis sp. NPDC050513 TaxID=3364338 RepID=UPI0037ACD3CB
MSEGELWEGLAGTRAQGPNDADAALSAVLNTVSVLSTDLGRLGARLDTAVTELGDQDDRLTRTMESALERLQVVEELAGQVRDLAAAVADLGEGDREGPPQPWNWSAMSDEERQRSVALLGAWVRDVLFTRWPWTQRRLQWCWAYHPELLQDLSMLHVAYRQAYEHSGRRSHHETDFRHTLVEVMAAAPDVFTRDECPTTPARHPIAAPARDDERFWRLASVGDSGAEEPVDGFSADPEPLETEQTRDRLLARLHALNEQARDHTLPQEHRDQARSRMAELVRRNGITQEEYREFRAELNRP